jgi:hypothetical protein
MAFSVLVYYLMSIILIKEEMLYLLFYVYFLLLRLEFMTHLLTFISIGI